MANCEPDEVEADVCALSTDDHLRLIQKNLPNGPAWTRDENSTASKYWRSFAEVIKYLEDRGCALLEEFFCDTASETLDVWSEQYGVPAPITIDATDPCLKAGYTQEDVQEYYETVLCAKLAAQGGNECTYFVETALSLGWVITCEDTSQLEYAQAGCSEAGCATLGPPPVFQGSTNLGWEDLNGCEYGAAVNHPYPEAWPSTRGVGDLDRFSQDNSCATPGTDLGKDTIGEDCVNYAGYRACPLTENQSALVAIQSAALRQNLDCAVPGSELGVGYLGDDCCNFSGYYELDTESVLTRDNACAPQVVGKPDVAIDNSIVLPTLPLDSSELFLEYGGHANTLLFTIDSTASMVLQDSLSPFEEDFTLTGCTFCGDTCTPLNGYEESYLREFVESIVPAHIQVTWERA